MPEPASPEANAAYRAGLCRDCRTKPYAAGMPRCDGCHAKQHDNEEVR